MTARHRSLLPREHGAYAQLLAPLAAALVVRLPTRSSALFAIAACCAFLANEPLLVILGHRGERAREVDGNRALRRLAATVVAAWIAGGLGLLLANDDARVCAMLVAVPAGVLVAFACARAERTIGGELFAALALPGASAPVLVASGIHLRDAVALSLAWFVGFASTVIAVHRVIERRRRRATWLDRGLAATTMAAIWRAPAVAPLALVSTWLVLAPPAATRLRAIGVALVVASVASAGLVIATGG